MFVLTVDYYAIGPQCSQIKLRSIPLTFEDIIPYPSDMISSGDVHDPGGVLSRFA